MSILVTGGAGFIGANLVRALNARGITNIIIVDNLGTSQKFKNLVGCSFERYIDKDVFRKSLQTSRFDDVISHVFHQGACSDTMELDGTYMMDNNYEYSVELFNFAQRHSIPFIYASSAAVYGDSIEFDEIIDNENPLNVYGYSKYLFDQFVRSRLEVTESQIVGLRYFNVYGPRESHKGRMASVALHFYNQFKRDSKLQLYEGSGGYGAGEQRRDFIYVDDVVRLNLEFFDNPARSGIFNCGTGRSQTFNDVAVATINAVRKNDDLSPITLQDMIEQGLVTYIAFPDGLQDRYQSFTEANTIRLQNAGSRLTFTGVEDGIQAYIDYLGDGIK